ncbi:MULTISPECIES: hypothetical protein [Stenotrophomonas]|uniref:hypothetical protein n=1 Tax=Stenotrophomonas TaxID=40323 RepID=UPI0018D479F4|nr:hypothetical protein [Stenotrophomonas sp.]MBH1508378.1 hypothetical protein [Stenotrophomonas maltophilia]
MLEAFFVATAKAAPAATAAASDGSDWKWLVPVATLIIGFGLKWLQDHFTERSRRKHEATQRREQRYDALRMRRLDAERQNLLALQPLMVRFVRAATVLAHQREYSVGLGNVRSSSDGSPEAKEELRLSSAELVPFQARIHSTDVVSAMNAVIDAVSNCMDQNEWGPEAQTRWKAVDGVNKGFHTVIGNTIKALEDENQQLGDPPTR